MKYLDEYRDTNAAEKLAEAIRRITTRPWVIMEVCGGQTHTIVITGLEPVDMLERVLMTVRQLEAGEAKVENQYSLAVRQEGNLRSRELMEEVFEVCDRKWRGVGIIPKSGFKLRCEYRDHDAERIFEVDGIETEESTQRISGQVLKGLKKPHDCPTFGTTCTPHTPLGATMASSEGACAAYYAYGRHLEARACAKNHSPQTEKLVAIGVTCGKEVQTGSTL